MPPSQINTQFGVHGTHLPRSGTNQFGVHVEQAKLNLQFFFFLKMSLQLLWDANPDTQCVELPATTYQWFRWASVTCQPGAGLRIPVAHRLFAAESTRATSGPSRRSRPGRQAVAGTAPPRSIATARGLVGDFFRRARLAGVASVRGRAGRAQVAAVSQPIRASSWARV